ncbi:copper-binding oxazolone/thioamide-containing RiPP [Thalassolituus sp. LLYu03]|uniref:HvfA family oxazolone/thioamide-modified RiPP metallophore n=1 Tax=Thalassolituus sp. LLYu03 TaxID=3421656 RepID=UPI003D2AFB9D
MNNSNKSLSAVLGSVLFAAISQGAVAAENPFTSVELTSGYQQLAANNEGNCGAKSSSEAKCGADKAAKSDSEAKCGADKAAKSEREGQCGADKKASKSESEGKCGEAKCGADKK